MCMGMHSILLAKSFDLDGFSMWSEIGMLLCVHEIYISCNDTHIYCMCPCSCPRAHERARAHDKLHTMTYLLPKAKKKNDITSMEFWKRNASHPTQNHTVFGWFRFYLCMRIL